MQRNIMDATNFTEKKPDFPKKKCGVLGATVPC